MKIKALLKTKINNKTKDKLVNNKRGSELAQTILITAVMVVLIATLFFPQIQSLMSDSMTKMSGWFNSVLSSL